jgi:hypothetical protein
VQGFGVYCGLCAGFQGAGRNCCLTITGQLLSVGCSGGGELHWVGEVLLSTSFYWLTAWLLFVTSHVIGRCCGWKAVAIYVKKSC